MRAIAALLAVAAARAATFSAYIDPSGDDSAPGTRASPWKTPHRCLEQVVTLRKQHGGKIGGSFACVVNPGLYAMEKPLTLTAAASGDSVNDTVSFTAADPGSPNVFSGGAVLGVVNQGDDGTVELPIPPAVNSGGRIRQLFRLKPQAVTYDVPLGRRTLARTPVATYSSLSAKSLKATPGPLDGQAAASLENSEAVIYHSWTASITPVASWAPATHTLSFAGSAPTACDSACFNRFYVQNVQNTSSLARGSFFVRGSGANRTVVYRPLPDETVTPGDFAVPNIPEVVVTAPGDAASHIRFDGITFAHGSSSLQNCIDSGCSGQSDSQSDVALVHLNNATDVTLFNVTVRDTGNFGLWFDTGCAESSASWVFFRHTGAGAVRVGTDSVSAGRIPTGIVVSDSLINNTGMVLEAGPGVLVQQAANITITHNRIMHTRYTAVSAGWTWGYAPTVVRSINVSYNDMSDVFMGGLSDGGCVYTLGIQYGSTVENNRCWGVDSAGYGGWGYYTDEGSSGITFSRNLAYNTKSAGFHQHYGLDNVITNNIIAFPGAWKCQSDAPNCDNAGLRSSQHSPGSKKGSLSSFTFERNIILLNQSYSTPFYTSIPTGLKNMTLDNNVYWSTSQGSKMQFGPTQAQVPFSKWQADGKDVHSVVADPKFSDAERYLFSLMPDSPALALGFKQIDFSTNGPRNMP